MAGSTPAEVYRSAGALMVRPDARSGTFATFTGLGSATLTCADLIL